MGIRQIAAIGIGGTAVAGGVGGLYYVSQDKTIKDRLTSQGIKLIDTKSEQKVWQLAWEEIKSEDGLKNVETTVTDDTTLKNWCISAYDKPLSEEKNLKKAEKICVQPSLTIGERLIRTNKKLTEDWKKKLESLTNEKSLLEELKVIDSKGANLTQNKKAEEALKAWCESNQNTKLTIQDKEYPKVLKICI